MNNLTKHIKVIVQKFISDNDLIVSMDGTIYGKLNANKIVEIIEDVTAELLEENELRLNMQKIN